MFTRIKKLFAPQIIYRVVEVDKPRTSPRLDRETKDMIAALAAHPGFIALLDRIKLQKRALEGKLNKEFHKDIREVDHYQSGIFWLNYIEELVSNSTAIGSKKYVDPYAEELEAFKQLDAQIERVGM